MSIKFYINGIGCISPQELNTRLPVPIFTEATEPKRKCIEPDYKNWMPAMQLRRMSKVVKMGVTSAKIALQDAQITTPDLITTGTAYGCLADTELFLQKMISQQETLLTPTSFIQSTHNTVSGQIALMVACHGHNFTYVHRGHSFESSLQETIMWLHENPTLQILSGGVDELTNDSFEVMARFGTYKKDNKLNETHTDGTIAGEGSAMFIISTIPQAHSYCEIVDMHLCFEPNIESELISFLTKNNLSTSEIDTCFIGTNGDQRYDEIIFNNMSSLTNTQFIEFKKWCGEYPTSGSFAMALASMLIAQKHIPESLIMNTTLETNIPQNVLIYNHYKNQFHSFILLRAI